MGESIIKTNILIETRYVDLLINSLLGVIQDQNYEIRDDIKEICRLQRTNYDLSEQINIMNKERERERREKMGEKNNHNDEDFDEVIFEDLPSYNPPFVRSTKHQRELLERLAARKGLHYPALIRKCNEVIDREGRIKDIGELSVGEADKVIKEIGEIRR